jgi:hypothetical protein
MNCRIFTQVICWWHPVTVGRSDGSTVASSVEPSHQLRRLLSSCMTCINNKFLWTQSNEVHTEALLSECFLSYRLSEGKYQNRFHLNPVNIKIFKWWSAKLRWFVKLFTSRWHHSQWNYWYECIKIFPDIWTKRGRVVVWFYNYI